MYGMEPRPWVRYSVALVFVGVLVVLGWNWYLQRQQFLDRVVVSRTAEVVVVDLQFNGPVQYQAHFPPERGPVLQVLLRPAWWFEHVPNVYLDPSAIYQQFSGNTPLAVVAYESDVPGGPMVSLRFTATQHFRVHPGPDGKSLRVELGGAGLASRN